VLSSSDAISPRFSEKSASGSIFATPSNSYAGSGAQPFCEAFVPNLNILREVQSVTTDEEWSKRLNLYVYLYAINLSLELDMKTSSLYRPFNIVMQIYKQNTHDLIPTCVNVQRFKTVDMANHKH